MEDLINYFTQTQFYGNTPLRWAGSFCLIILSVVAGRFLYWAIGKTVKRLAAQTETTLDDILVDMVEEPFVFGSTLIGIWYSLSFLEMTAEFRVFVSNAFHFLIVFNVAWLITRLFNALVEEYLVPLVQKSESDLDDLLLPFIKKSTNAGVWVLAIIMALNNAGYDVGAILTGLGIGGLAFALAAKETVMNLISAITIFMDRPFVTGDLVRINGHLGFIREIGMRSTQIELKFNKQRLIVPNTTLVNEIVVNISREPSRMYQCVLNFPNDLSAAGAENAENAVRECVEKHPFTLDEIHTWYTFGPETLDLNLRYQVSADCRGKCWDYDQVQGEINKGILTALETAGIARAVPVRRISRMD